MTTATVRGVRHATDRRGRGAVAVPLALLAGAAFLVSVRWHPGGPLVGRAIDDTGQLAAAAVASWCTGLRARAAQRTGSPAALAWALWSVGTGCWALGELAWCWFELIAGRQTPFPSIADAGFLLFPVFAVAGLLAWPSAAVHGGRRWRTLLDGVLVAGSLFIVSWVTALGSAARSGGDGRFAYVVSLAYPVTDLVLLTLVVVVVAHARDSARSGLGLLAVGLSALVVADSGFAYLTSTGRYATGSVVDAGWFGGFLLIAAAATTAAAPAAAPRGNPVDAAMESESTAAALLPYLPAGVGLGLAVVGELTGRGQKVASTAAGVVVIALLIRQLLAVLDNRRLLRQLQRVQLELRHQAFHDPLTGLANRALFTDRLNHGLQLRRRDRRPLGLIYLDLDGFKAVNDSHGHEAGDAVLKAASERLRAVTRPGDTVARLGGDEFAVLVEDGGDAGTVVARLLDALTQPAVVGRHSVFLGASVGLADLTPDAAPVTPAEFLRRADAAMYQAKRSGKGCAVCWNDQLPSGTLSGGGANVA